MIYVLIFKKPNNKFDDEIEFFLKNYYKIYMGEYCYDPWDELKINVEFFVEHVYWK
jgi:hypothetical protein